MGQFSVATDNVIRARRIELLDENGRVRMVAETDKFSGKNTSLTLIDGDGEMRIELRACPKSEGVEQGGSGTGSITILTAHPDGVELFDLVSRRCGVLPESDEE